MSNVATSAERTNVDLTHFIYSTGGIGRLKTLNMVHVFPGDSFEMNYVGAFRLSPFRRGLSVDSNIDVFTFYVPLRHCYGNEFIDALKAGVPKSGAEAILSTDAIRTPNANIRDHETTMFLGTNHRETAGNRILPKHVYQSYLNIYNNYFKKPFDPDITTALASLDDESCRDGFKCAHLECIWSKPLNPNVDVTQKFADMAGNDGIDIIGLNAAYGKLHTQQERDHFMQRYRDVVTSFGGKTHYDADVRPHLVMRSNFWASGYDTDGTTPESLGQFSGRVQQSFTHRVPRFYVPEHGVMVTLMLVRFPPIHEAEFHASMGRGWSYSIDALDPAIISNSPPFGLGLGFIFAGYTGNENMLLPHSQKFRFHPSHVDFRYRALQGFPFLTRMPSGNPGTHSESMTMVEPTDYDKCFQTTQLGHWNIQSKMNVHVMRHIPSARDSIITN